LYFNIPAILLVLSVTKIFGEEKHIFLICSLHQ